MIGRSELSVTLCRQPAGAASSAALEQDAWRHEDKKFTNNECRIGRSSVEFIARPLLPITAPKIYLKGPDASLRAARSDDSAA